MTIYECKRCGKLELDHSFKDVMKLLLHSWFRVGCKKPKCLNSSNSLESYNVKRLEKDK